MAANRPAAKKAAASPPAATNGKATVTLPTSVESEAAEWQGSKRGAGQANAELRKQLAENVSEMTGIGATRNYNLKAFDVKQKAAFISLFRKVVDEVWIDDETKKPAFGVQVGETEDGLTQLRLSKRVSRTRKAKGQPEGEANEPEATEQSA